mmetsp:Transcript_29891/g.54763  ORF Transcript_29891/g.54763 Transcript_29891/m.54763 type:complete len:181 (-) Transcript_29891:39-581(-)
MPSSIHGSRSAPPPLEREEQRFAILWSPLPPITWILPFIGHMGIGDSRGVAHDFQGPYYVGNQGRMAFGSATRYLSFQSRVLSTVGEQRWDEAIAEADVEYRGRMHNICCDNCHSHVANALNRMPDLNYYAISKWDMVKLCFLIFFRAPYVNWKQGICSQFLPITIILILFVLLPTLLTK